MTNQDPHRTLLLASPRGWCAGVDRAVDVVDQLLVLHGAPVYVRKQIVHNLHVVRDLEAKGAIFVEEIEEVPEGSVAVFSAHGVSPAVRAEADARNLTVMDATCPLVTKVHMQAIKYARNGYTMVFIGHEGHEEVEGTMGEAPDNMVLVHDEAAVDTIE
ncbi:MAG: 4-hydroxy-3-methylbut-2-enyl diphosphate reductase, partial [Thermoleophilia bacterium]|nr:4-hydroxy-3-methylbut-2-enyl diphosphate reductase [Thermoleophilia bacterium]